MHPIHSSRSPKEETSSTLRIVYAICFVDLFAVGIIFPSLQPYMKSFGCSNTEIGILQSLYAVLQVLSGPIVGSWCDVRGPKVILNMTLLLSSIFYFLMGFSTNLIFLIFFRLLLGICKHTQTLNKALVADLTGNNKQLNTAVYGKCASYSSLGFVFGPIVGGHISQLDNGFQYICTLTSILFVINIVLVQRLPDMEPTRPCRKTIAANISNEFKTVVRDLAKVDWSKHWGGFALKFLFVLVTTMFFSSQPVYLKENFNADKLQVGYVISFVSLVGMISGFYMVPLTRYFYDSEVSRSCAIRTFHVFLTLTLCFVGFCIVSNAQLFVFMLIPFGICNTVLRILTMELVLDKCRKHERGSLTGASDSMMSFGRFMGPLTAGLMIDFTTTRCVMMYAALISLIGAGIAFHIDVVEEMEEMQKRHTKMD